MPALSRLNRTWRGLSGLMTRALALAVPPPSPLRCAEVAIATALRVNGAVLNRTNAALSDIENRRAGGLGTAGTGDNDDMTVGEVSPERTADQNGADGAPGPDAAGVMLRFAVLVGVQGAPSCYIPGCSKT